ncbi:MAG: Na+/H+ antiporter NhaC family protein [Woeseiaceae bacterium]|nr:Na+/H+ antiporter NhaC family protein [Woeseiaceae bacterium]
MTESDWGFFALAPLAVTLILAFWTRSALVGMLAGVIAGVVMLGQTPGAGVNDLLQRSLGNGDFIWICEIVILIGVLFQLFRRAEVLKALAFRFSSRHGSRRQVEVTTWGMGFLIVDDYFSPLLTGAVMRPLSDRARIPREKLAFLLDTTTASVCILVPFTAWGAYLASLIAAQGGPVAGADQGLNLFIRSIVWNFYPMLMLLFGLLVAAGLLPDFGPMRKAEQRVRDTGAVLRPGARPLVSDDGVDVDAPPERDVSLLLELALPVLLLIGYAAWSLVQTGSVAIVEAFMLAVAYLFVTLWLRGGIDGIEDAASLVVQGASSVMAALLVVALAYALNAVTAELGAADVIIRHFADDLTPNSVVALTFLLAAGMSFATGTSWGTFALMMPVSLPLAFEFSGGQLTPLVYQTIAAVAGGGIFGDHASPVSDTSVLSSVGAGSDHIDHVVTQLPYALIVAAATLVIYALI